MGYHELLKDERWKEFSSQIIERDNFTCQHCKEKGHRNDIYHAIPDLDYILKMFDRYRFDEISFIGKKNLFVQKSLREIIDFPIDYNYDGDVKCYFRPSEHIKNLYTMQFSNIKFNSLYHSLTNLPLYSEFPIVEELAFKYQCFEIEKMTKDRETILSRLVIYAIRFQKECDTTKGYLKISSEAYKSSIVIITSEYYIEIVLFNCSIIEKPSKFDFLFKKLNVHHTFYKYGNPIPWDYNPNTLITICEECHCNFHKKNSVPIKDEHYVDVSSSLQECDRCNGIGFLPQYKHIENGICFKCRGTKKIFTS